MQEFLLLECPYCKTRKFDFEPVGPAMEPVEVGSSVFRCSICGTIGKLQENAFILLEMPQEPK